MKTSAVTNKWNPWFRQQAAVGLRYFDKVSFYKWGYHGNEQTIYDFFKMYQMGGEL